MRSTRERTIEDIEQRASLLAEAVQRTRERTYAGARVIEIAPIAEPSANNYDSRPSRVETNILVGSTSKNLSNGTTKAEPDNEKKEELKTEKTVKVKKEKNDADGGKPKRRGSQKKSRKSTRKPRESSSTEDSEDDEPDVKKRILTRRHRGRIRRANQIRKVKKTVRKASKKIKKKNDGRNTT